MTENGPISAELPDESPSQSDIIPVVNSPGSFLNPGFQPRDSSALFREALAGWLMRSASPDTRSNYSRDLTQFREFVAVHPDRPEELTRIVPWQVAAWRD